MKSLENSNKIFVIQIKHSIVEIGDSRGIFLRWNVPTNQNISFKYSFIEVATTKKGNVFLRKTGELVMFSCSPVYQSFQKTNLALRSKTPFLILILS